MDEQRTPFSTWRVAALKNRCRPGGSGCNTLCAAASCSFDTSRLADGLYGLRSLVTDRAGNSGTSVVASRRVDNAAPSIAVGPPPATLRDELTLTVSASDGDGDGIASVRYQVRPASSGTWIDVCATATAPFSCSADTTAAPDGLYDVRAIATDGAGLSTASATISGRIDNTDPSSATLADPGSPLTGTVALSATAADAGSGVASVRFERTSAGGSAWTTICTDSAAPYSCAWDTTAVADGLYDLRVVATDAAGNTFASSTVANRRTDAAVKSVRVSINGRRRGSAMGSRATIDIRGLPRGTVRVRVSATLSTGRKLTL